MSTFLVLWPFGSRLHGLSVEVGYLLTCLTGNILAPEQVVLVPEAHNARLRADDGELTLLDDALSEPGNRTRYYRDLADLGCPIQRLHRPQDLGFILQDVALGHALRGRRRTVFHDRVPEAPGETATLDGP